jgi:hypothetical protein
MCISFQVVLWTLTVLCVSTDRADLVNPTSLVLVHAAQSTGAVTNPPLPNNESKDTAFMHASYQYRLLQCTETTVVSPPMCAYIFNTPNKTGSMSGHEIIV